MIDVNPWTKKGREIMYDYERCDYGSIYDAYERPSCTKVRTYREIEDRARETPGYNYDLKVVGKSCHFYSTVYSYTDGGTTFIVKDTPSYTYRMAI